MNVVQNNSWFRSLEGNIDLHRAQDAAYKSINTKFFPCYTEAYVQSLQGIRGYSVWIYSRTYIVVSFVGDTSANTLRGAGYLVQCIAIGIFRIEDFFLGWATRPLAQFSYDYGFCHVVTVFNVVFPINEINGRRHFVGMSREDEKFLGDTFLYPHIISGMRRTYQRVPNTQEKMEDKVNAILNRLKLANRELLHCEIDGEPSNGQTQFNYRSLTARSDQVNAFAVPGGGMVVFKGLIEEMCESIGSIREAQIELADGSRVRVDLSGVTFEDALAAIIAHETTHVASRHSVVAIMFEIVFVYFLRLLALLPLDCTPIVDLIVKFKELFLDTLFSRKNEIEADVTGAYFANQAGYNPLGAIYAQEFLKQIHNVGYADIVFRYFEIFFTHPYSENRKRALLASIEQFAPETLQGNLNSYEGAADRYDPNRSSSGIQYAQHMREILGA